jgi:cation diffusion facilitator family transporter
MESTDIRTVKASRVTWVGFFVNLILVSFKLVAGIIGSSTAMIADAMHSLSDFATDIVVLASMRVVNKPADQSHNYGHGKFETLAAAAIALALFLALMIIPAVF